MSLSLSRYVPPVHDVQINLFMDFTVALILPLLCGYIDDDLMY